MSATQTSTFGMTHSTTDSELKTQLDRLFESDAVPDTFDFGFSCSCICSFGCNGCSCCC
ncbi:hypothetical protein [Halorussus litoreus]|uniref:hypothetical protein n=1 Tax=Halorussus litoreus TaxID=1710536 RepID=UPI0018E542BC|nr:hypothetical protein [Halorussus litoreus]